MKTDQTTMVYFSGTGTTRKVIEAMWDNLSGQRNDYNLLLKAIKSDVVLEQNNLTIVAMPVYNGRIPAICSESIQHLKGNKTPAIAVVVYGNREYDDALLELKEMLEGQGFFVVGAAAFVARHSIFPEVATDRPDAKDITIIADFTKQCMKKLAALNSASDNKAVTVRGNSPYRPLKGVPMKPSFGDDCDRCGACVPQCPTQAITIDGNTITSNDEKCISCGACISVCPLETRIYRGADYEKFKGKFIDRFSARREPECFV